MKNLKIFALLLMVAALCFGQTATTQTTLSSAVAATDQSVTVASATGITARGSLNQATTLLFVDSEEMEVTTVNGTIIGVVRGRDGTPVTTHASGAIVWAGPPSNGPFVAKVVPGSCTAANYPYLPIIEMSTGNLWSCINGTWGRGTLPGMESYLNEKLGAAVASAATIAPTGKIFHVTGTTTINTITLPAGFTQGCLVLIPDGLWSTGTSGNIALATTGVVSKGLTECYDPGTSKFYPSY